MSPENKADATDGDPAVSARPVPNDWYGDPLFFAACYGWLSSSQMAARHFGLCPREVADFQQHLFDEEPTREPTEEERRRCNEEAERMGIGPDNPVRRDVVHSLLKQLVTPPPFQATLRLAEETHWTTVFEATALSHFLETGADLLPMGCLGPHPVVPILRWEELFELAERVREPIAFTFLLTPCCADRSADDHDVVGRLEKMWTPELDDTDLETVVDFMLRGKPDDRERQRLKAEAEQIGLDAMMPPSGRIEASWSHHPEPGWITEAPNSYRNPDSEYGAKWRERGGFDIFNGLFE